MSLKRMVSLLSAIALLAGIIAGCDSSPGTESRPASELEDQPLTEELYPKDDVYTTYVTRSKYNMETSIQVDGTGVRPETISSFPTTYDVKSLGGGTCANQDVYGKYTSGEYDGQTHDEDIFRTRNGEKYGYSLLQGIHYMLPTENWNRFLLTQYQELISLGIKRLGMSEQGIWGSVGYEEGFRQEWKAYYNEDWQPFWDDQELYYKAQQLKSHLMLRQIEQVFKPLKEADPGLTLTLGSHTSLAYFSFTNPIANHDSMALPYVDGMQGQTWSNTMELPFSYNGGSMARPFVNGYVDYSYWANLGRQFPTKTISFTTDAKGDGYTGKSLEDCFKLYQHQLAAQLIFPNVYRYDFEWPDRAYSAAGYSANPVSTDAYKVIMNNITSLQGQMYKYQDAAQTPNRDIRVGALLLDTSNFQAGGPQSTVNNNSFYGLLAGLVYNGLLVDAIPVGSVKDDVNILGEYDIVLVSYDLMKPGNTLCSDNLKEYLQNGGTVLYMGGAGEYEDLSYSWWKKAGFDAPEEHLLSILGCDVTGRTVGLGASVLVAEDGSSLAENVGDITAKVDKARITGYDVGGNVQVLYRAGGKAVAFEKAVGKGNFYFFGMDPAYFCMRDTGDTLWDIVAQIARERLSKTIAKNTSISYQRGPVYGFNAISGDAVTAEGRWINLFDETLPVISSLEVKEGDSALLLDVSEKYASAKPVVLFAQGNNPTVIENRLITRVVTAGPENTSGTIRIFIPEGYKISRLAATNMVTQKDVLVDRAYDAETRSLLITYKNNVSKVIVDVEYVQES